MNRRFGKRAAFGLVLLLLFVCACGYNALEAQSVAAGYAFSRGDRTGFLGKLVMETVSDEYMQAADAAQSQTLALWPALISPLEILQGTWAAFCVKVRWRSVYTWQGSPRDNFKTYDVYLYRNLGGWYGKYIVSNERCPWFSPEPLALR